MNLLLLTATGLVAATAALPLLGLRLRRLQQRVRVQDHEFAEFGRRIDQQARTFEGVLERFDRLREHLVAEGVTETFPQPVLLVGPRGVGKTSLFNAWRSPWTSDRTSPTFRHEFAEVPVCDLRSVETRPHPADPETLTPVHAHLVLRVHDFSGEVHGQQLVEKIVRDETVAMRKVTRKDLGIVIVCMFDAEEAATGISDATARYYTGELFQHLRNLVFTSEARIERLVLVFNKLDHLRNRCDPHWNDAQLLDVCFRYFFGAFRELGGICNHERISGVLTMLNGEHGVENLRGPAAIMGESARAIVEAFGGTAGPDVSPEFAQPVPSEYIGIAS